MQRTLLLILLASLLFSACTPQEPAATIASPGLTLSDCVLQVSAKTQIKARCGSLDVPENPDNPQGRQIALNLVVIPAVKKKPAPDPLFLLAGGPGQSAVETFPSMLALFYKIHESRDLVLLDQRGTGKSNPLHCLDPEKDENLSETQALERLQACPGQLDADVRFYTTEIAMQDLDAVRAALGYETINLYGASYGTRAALTYLRMFPARVRTIALDAVVDPQFVMFQDAAADGQQALDLFFARCQADPTCQETFPNLRAEFDDLLSRLEKNPVTISMPHPLTNKPMELTVTREMVTGLIFNTLYSPDLVATLPLSLHSAAAQGNFIPLISQSYMLDAGISDGMFYAVTCTEDAPLVSASEAAKNSQGSIFGDRTVDFVKVCESWPKGQVSASFRAPLASDVPALLLSGEADPITPPWHAEKAAASLRNGLHLVFKGMGHSNITNSCAANLLSDFIERGSVTGLDATCTNQIQPPPFFVDFSGPRP